MDKYTVLKHHFGYASFRGGQERLIDAVLDGRDVLGIMPTGGGKSLCYQIPALLLPGMTVVVSPLISLMKDQVMALKNAGVAAAYVNSSLTGEQLARVYDNIRRGVYKLLYIAPERLQSDGFSELARRLPIALLAGGRGALHFPVGQRLPAELSADCRFHPRAVHPPRRGGLYRDGDRAGPARH